MVDYTSKYIFCRICLPPAMQFWVQWSGLSLSSSSPKAVTLVLPLAPSAPEHSIRWSVLSRQEVGVSQMGCPFICYVWPGILPLKKIKVQTEARFSAFAAVSLYITYVQYIGLIRRHGRFKMVHPNLLKTQFCTNLGFEYLKLPWPRHGYWCPEAAPWRAPVSTLFTTKKQLPNLSLITDYQQRTVAPGLGLHYALRPALKGWGLWQSAVD